MTTNVNPNESTDTSVTEVQPKEISLVRVTRIEMDVVDMELSEFGKQLSPLSIEELEVMIQHINGNLWEKITHPGIRKMRLIMELKAGYYPDLVPQQKSHAPSEWKGIPTQVMLDKVKSEGLEYIESYHEGIRRMRLILALREAGITPDSLH